jgi:hypothetical protein
MLGIGAIEIEQADYCLGMCGSITVRINKTGKLYRVHHSMSDGWQVSESDDGGREYSRPKRMEPEAFIALLPEGHGMTYNVFIALWAGFSAGHERGQKDEQNRWWELERRRKANETAQTIDGPKTEG